MWEKNILMVDDYVLHKVLDKIKEMIDIDRKKIMVDDYVLHKVSDKIKEIIVTEKFEDTKIVIYTANKLPDDITLKKPCDINYVHFKRWW